MNIKETKEFLQQHLVPKKLYKIGKSKKNRICLEKEGDIYAVFFKDKKDEVGKICFNTETDACKAFLEEIRKLMEGIYEITWFKTV